MGDNEVVVDAKRGRISPELVELLCELRGEPVLSTRDIAEIAGIDFPMARTELMHLVEQGEIERRTVDGGEYWWKT